MNADIKEAVVDWRERILVNTLYIDQSVKIRVERRVTRNMKIRREVRQGYCLSLILINLYREYFTKKTLQGFVVFGATDPSWSWPPHSRSF